MQNLVRSTLSLTFVISAARVVFNIKSRMTRETSWQLELKGDLTKQRRVEAVDKLLSVLTLLVGTVFGLQAIGLDGARTPRRSSSSCRQGGGGGGGGVGIICHAEWEVRHAAGRHRVRPAGHRPGRCAPAQALKLLM